MRKPDVYRQRKIDGRNYSDPGISFGTALRRMLIAGGVLGAAIVASWGNVGEESNKTDKPNVNKPGDGKPTETASALNQQNYPLPEGVEPRQGFSPLTGFGEGTDLTDEPSRRPDGAQNQGQNFSVPGLPEPTMTPPPPSPGGYGADVIVDPSYVDVEYDCNKGPCIKIQAGGNRYTYGIEGQNGNPDARNYVSERNEMVTDFDAISLGPGREYLGAHNMLAGRWFNQILPGDQAVVLKNGNKSCYEAVVTKNFKMAWADTRNPVGPMIGLEDGVEYSSGQIWEMLKSSGYEMVLQTCISNNGDDFWGRLFVFYKKIDCSETKIDLVYLFVSRKGVMTLVRKFRKDEKRRHRHKNQH